MSTYDLDLHGLHEVSFTRKRKLPGGRLMNGAANEHANIAIWKADGPQHEEEGRMSGTTELEKLAADLAEADTPLAEQAAEIERLNKAVAAAETEVKLREKDLSVTKTELERELAKNADPEEALLKTMPEAAQKAFLAQKAATERLEKRLAEADEQAKLAEIAKSFDKEFSGLPTKGEDVAPIMKAVYGVLDEDQAKELRRLLKAGSEAMTELLKISGMTGSGHDHLTKGAEAEIDTLAKARAEKEGISYAKAYSAVLTDNPALYEKYRAEQTH